MPELNSHQRQAVQAGQQSVLIVAGPGTGKTKTLTARIAYLINQSNVQPGQILALTFTNKAAHEMKERVTMLLPKGTQTPTITTFHGFCYRILEALEKEPPRLINEADRRQIIADLKKSLALKKLSVRELGLQLSRAKNQITPPEGDLASFLDRYNQALADKGLYDFDDLLLRLYKILQKNSAKRKDLQSRYQAILVDEFQDTNQLQYELLKLIAGSNPVFAIGDPLQSIYGFRGASAAVFDRFLQDWPDALQIRLRINYRSVPEVVRLGSATFPDQPSVHAHRQEDGQVRQVQVLNEYSEATWITETIERHIGGSTMLKSSTHHTDQQHASFRDFAVLYRSHVAAKVLERLLDESGMPYQVAGDGSPYERPEAKLILAALAHHNNSGPTPEVKGMTQKQVSRLLDPLKSEKKPLSQLATLIANKLNLEQTPSLRQFINSMIRFDNQTITTYLGYVQAISEQAFYDPAAEAITLLTIHAAKGLEFKHVFLIGAEEGILPHYRPGNEPNLDEERRLFYVAVTRAQDNLDILYTKTRNSKPATTSRFVTQLDKKTLPAVIDPAMDDQLKRIKKRAQKRSQTSLF